MAGNACRACIEVEAVIECAPLLGDMVQLDPRIAPDRPVPPADSSASLQYRDVVAGLSKFIARREPGDSRAQNHDFDSRAGLGRQRWRARVRDRDGRQAERLHRDVSGPDAAQDADLSHKFPPRYLHFTRLSRAMLADYGLPMTPACLWRSTLVERR
jgi:hypothetical protein